MPRRYTAEDTIATALSTELNSLANGSICAVSAEIDNTTSGKRWPYMEVEVVIAATAARSVGAFCALYLVPEVDDTNYPDASTSTTGNEYMSKYYVDSFPLDAATTARRLVTKQLDLPPGNFKLALSNNTGVALAASGNTVKFRRYSDDYAA
ncbi:MAG: hypothetical protein KKF85_03410 [Gammaproteobacteria bacterium]|nr:hypothetical protein [Rhodocyclaceae bacterium]MBU3908871.1 hypothetical protein [Gammaproteobacteria bacterium]MBU3987738.1 hypothetical protein [Gammaproteobacteria bacterium]MBU4003349.1 hypothetical protein [Gammaproteobacteria bacterium]MBU4021820.1 hypothetical protein [Gammaproteobacteria bacterium]